MANKKDVVKDSKKKGAVEERKNGLKPCDKPHVAESTRTKDKDEACDDGVH